MAKKLVPLLNRVLVQKIVAPTKSEGGVLLPETAASSKINTGKVIAVGAGGRANDGSVIPVAVQEGDTVLLPEYGGNQMKLGDEEYVLYRDEEILGIFKD